MDSTNGPSAEINISDFDLPVIDFMNWKTDSTLEERYATGKELADACHNVGFVYIINHGIESQLLEEAFMWSKRLFNLAPSDKMLAPHPPGPNVHRGYSYPGLEKVSQVISEDIELGEKLREVKDCKESYEIGSEENDEQPNQWLPDHVLPGFREFMVKFYWECSKTSMEILKAIAMGIGLSDVEYFVKFHSGHNK